MKNKLISITIKIFILAGLVYLFLLRNQGDVEYIYANF